MPTAAIDDDAMPSEADALMPSHADDVMPSIKAQQNANPAALNIDPIAFNTTVNQPSQWSSGYFDGTPNLQDADDWSFTSALAEADKQEPLVEHIFDLGKNIATLPLTVPVTLATRAAEEPGAAIMNQLPTAQILKDITGHDVFQPGKPLVPAPSPNTHGIIPSIQRMASGMTTPGSLLLFGLTPESRPLQEAFSAGAIGAVPDSLENVVTARNGDEFKDALTGLGLDIGMAALAGRGSSRDFPAPAAEPEASAQTLNDETTLPSQTVPSAPTPNAVSSGLPNNIKTALTAKPILPTAPEPMRVNPADDAPATVVSQLTPTATVSPAPVASAISQPSSPLKNAVFSNM